MTSTIKHPLIVATYTLKTPIEYGGQLVTELNFRTPRAKDHIIVERAKVGIVESTVKYLQLLTEQVPFVIENLSQEDYTGAIDAMNALGSNDSFLK